MQGEQQANQEQIKKRPPLVCFHQYGEEEDAGEIFKKINEFKETRRIKFTHFKVKRIIYFIVPTEDVKDFASVIRFTKSTSSFRLVYKCGTNEKEAINLASQRDSFIRMKHVKNTDENGSETNDVIFTSKLPKLLHSMASRRIFESAEVIFDINKSISNNKKFRYDNDEDDKKETTNSKGTTVDEEIIVEEREEETDEQIEEPVAEQNSDNEEEEEVVKVEIVQPKKRGRKPAAPKIARKI